MDVVTVRMEQRIADVFPRPFAAGPRAEELDRIAVRLSPAPVELECFVQPPAKIIFSFDIGNLLPLFCIEGPRSIRHCLIPTLFPAVESEPRHRVNICSSAALVVTDHTGLKEDADNVGFTEPGVHSEFPQNSFQLTGEFS